jgi:hypothetical protein
VCAAVPCSVLVRSAGVVPGSELAVRAARERRRRWHCACAHPGAVLCASRRRCGAALRTSSSLRLRCSSTAPGTLVPARRPVWGAAALPRRAPRRCAAHDAVPVLVLRGVARRVPRAQGIEDAQPEEQERSGGEHRTTRRAPQMPEHGLAARRATP